MSNNIQKLLSIGSNSISDRTPYLSQLTKDRLGNLYDELHAILSQRNGFYAFESALHVFPADRNDNTINLERWNDRDLWRENYEFLMEDYLFFSEDIFGCQFCVLNDKIHSFDPETGSAEEVANSFDEWASKILDRSDFFTGFSLAHQWQLKNGRISIGERLIPKIPFVLGGEFVVDNLYNLEAVEGMQLRADLAKQIYNLEDGTQIKFKIVK